MIKGGKRLSIKTKSKIEDMLRLGKTRKDIMKRFGISKRTIYRIGLRILPIKEQNTFFNKYIEDHKEEYLPHMKNKCCCCERDIENNWQYYKMYGNFCRSCIIKSNQDIQPDNVMDFCEALLQRIDRKTLSMLTRD